MHKPSEAPLQRVAEERRRHLHGRSVIRRRPSGEPPPLPHELGRSGRFWVEMIGLFIASIIGLWLFHPVSLALERWETRQLAWIAELRTPLLTRIIVSIGILGSPWTIRGLRWSSIAALVVFRRWRHLLVFLGSVFVAEIVGLLVAIEINRPRPVGVRILGHWQGYSLPSRPVLGLAATLIGICYSLVIPGRPREISKWITGAVIGALVIARLYAAADHPTDVLFGVIFGVSIPLVAFRWFTPNDVFPVTYHRGKAAHLDISGRRGEAIRAAVRDQVGLDVLEMKPVGSAGAGGSTPIKLRVAGEEASERLLFAKLYAKSHVRADRWYKLGRTLLYGALEDETPFGSVRRFVEYEDYALRLLRDAGIAVPEPYGVIEITPEREYLILMEFFEGAVEIGEADVDDGVITSGLHVIRQFWNAGVAHRDIKPANLMVRDGRVLVIDVFFVQLRPSPWRQAVDLANMMLVLALRSDARRVFDQADRMFSKDEIAEAFAATRGIASPSQLRAMLKTDDRGLVEQFRAMAPERAPISIQRWSLRRVGLTAVVVLGMVVALLLIQSNWTVFA
jgi:tRNA A-37 threonylcarbamoyl transferase component Bud32